MSTCIFSRGMTKKELAALYAPGLSHASALRRLSRWLEQHPRLMRELKSQKYFKTQKKLNDKQLAIVFKYLGKPQIDMNGTRLV